MIRDQDAFSYLYLNKISIKDLNYKHRDWLFQFRECHAYDASISQKPEESSKQNLVLSRCKFQKTKCKGASTYAARENQKRLLQLNSNTFHLVTFLDMLIRQAEIEYYKVR